MDYLLQFLVFFFDALAVVVAVALIVLILAAVFSRNKQGQQGQLKIKKLNKQFRDVIDEVEKATLDKDDYKKLHKALKKKRKKHDHSSHPRLFVLDFVGDIRARQVGSLKAEINAILLSAKEGDQVFARIESPGGVVNGYGLAASQLQRLRDAKLKLTVAVDKVAASGGYMMACVADEIIAAPFAIIGSIGVVAQLPNFHRFLEKHDVDYEQVTAGDYKRTLSLFGKITKEGREKAQEEVEDTHGLFKNFIHRFRPNVDLDKVATGEHWFASQAIELGLIDRCQTSDDYLLAAREHFELYHIQYKIKQPVSKRFTSALESLLAKV